MRARMLMRSSGLMSYDSVSSDVNRLAKIKNLTMFDADLANDKLPQWMFITPNMSMRSFSLQEFKEGATLTKNSK